MEMATFRENTKETSRFRQDHLFLTMLIWVLFLLSFVLYAHEEQIVLSVKLSSNNRFAFVNPDDNTKGYTRFAGFCNSPVVATRRYTTDTICAYLCDRNKNCEGFQIYNDLQCILLAKKCETKDLMIFNGSSTDYYLKEVHCGDSATCQLASNCFAPTGFACSCVNNFCFPYPLNTQISEYYHLYCYERQEEVGHPLISVFDCIAKCNADPACANVVVIERRCQLTQFVCHDTGSSRISLNGTFGYDIYVKNKFYDFICKSNNECSTSPQSWCSKAKNCPCTCDSTHHCVLAVCSGIAPIALFFERLRTLDPIRGTDVSAAEFTDKHICCSEAFPTPADCSEEDYGICPRSCGQCKSGSCIDRVKDCDNKTLCTDPVNGDYMKAQCPVTCGTCGKTARSLGVTCRVCKDTLPNCQQLANAGLCQPDNTAKCRKSCGCFD